MYKSLRQILRTGTHTQRCCRCESASWNDDAWNGCSQKSTRCEMLQQKLLRGTCLQTGAPKKTKHWSRIRNEEDRVSSAVDCPRGLNQVPDSAPSQAENSDLMRLSRQTWKEIRSEYSHLTTVMSRRAGSEECDSYSSVCSLLSVHRSQANIRVTLCAFSSLRGAELPRLQVPRICERIFRLLKTKKRKIKVEKALRLDVTLSSWKPASFLLPRSLKECPWLLSPTISCRLAAAMKPSCRRLRFFTSLTDQEKSQESLKKEEWKFEVTSLNWRGFF